MQIHLEESKILVFTFFCNSGNREVNSSYKFKKDTRMLFFTFKILVRISSIQRNVFWRLNVSVFFTEKNGRTGGKCLLGFGVLHHFSPRKELLDLHFTEVTVRTHIFFRLFVAMIRGFLDSGVMVNL